MTRYYGNNVAYGSGGQWHVWVDVTDGGSNTGTQTDIYYTYGVEFDAPISDSSNAINWTDPWGSGDASNSNITHSGDTVVGGPFTNAVPIQYGGGPTPLHFHLGATGMANTPSGYSSVDFDYDRPGRTGTPPDTPGTPVASPITSSGAYISWGIPAENGFAIDAYHLQVGGAGVAYDNIYDGNTGYAWIYGMSRATLYIARVSAHNAAGWSGWTGVGYFTTLATAPDAPSAPSVGSIAQTSAVVSWSLPNNGGSPLDHIQAQVGTTGFASVVSDTGAVAPGGPPLSAAGLDPDTTYYARVRGGNAINWGAWSPSTPFTTLPGVHLRVSGAWVTIRPHNRVSGAWVSSKTHGRVSGAWS